MGPAAAELPITHPDPDGDYYTGLQEEHIDYVPFFSPAFGIWSRAKALGITVTPEVEGADVCVVVGGSKQHADHWRVNEETDSAIADAIENCTQVVVLVEVLGAILTPWRDNVTAIMSVFHAGEETATAWAATIFGDASPSGKLPISFPRVGQNISDYWEAQLPSYWLPDFPSAYPFGHGLSYASFIYQNMREKPRCHFPMCVGLTVLNSHPTNSGAEVVQVYFKFHGAPKGYPAVLRGFCKTKVLKPGQTDKAFFAFNHRDISLLPVQPRHVHQ
eukprot:UN0106